MLRSSFTLLFPIKQLLWNINEGLFLENKNTPFHPMDDHFTLGLNSNMELLDNTISPSLGNFNSSNDIGHEFTPLSGNNFVDQSYQRHDSTLPFIPLPDGTDEDLSFNFDGDHQAGSFYDQLTRLSPPTEDTVKRISGNKILGNSNPPILRSGAIGKNKANKNCVCMHLSHDLLY